MNNEQWRARVEKWNCKGAGREGTKGVDLVRWPSLSVPLGGTAGRPQGQGPCPGAAGPPATRIARAPRPSAAARARRATGRPRWGGGTGLPDAGAPLQKAMGGGKGREGKGREGKGRAAGDEGRVSRASAYASKHVYRRQRSHGDRPLLSPRTSHATTITKPRWLSEPSSPSLCTYRGRGSAGGAAGTCSFASAPATPMRVEEK